MALRLLCARTCRNFCFSVFFWSERCVQEVFFYFEYSFLHSEKDFSGDTRKRLFKNESILKSNTEYIFEFSPHFSSRDSLLYKVKILQYTLIKTWQ